MNWAVLSPLIGILITALVTYFVAAKRMSGKIANSDADALWKESGDIRDYLRLQLNAANDRTVALEGRLATLESRNTDLARENVELQVKILACERLGDELRQTISRLEETIKELRQ